MSPSTSTAHDSMLRKVRALLAKAESTEFPAEAEAITAKAQELMVRHAIDEALLSTERDTDETPEVRIVTIESPYARAKFAMLSGIAQANRCRAVWSQRTKEANLVGFPSDLDAVDLLFTSLLLQSTSAMLRRSDAEARTRSYRQAFLLSFAGVIASRLEEATRIATEEATAEVGSGFLPVLVDRSNAVEAAVDEQFPRLEKMRVSSSSATGSARGAHAGRNADLASRNRVGTRRQLRR